MANTNSTQATQTRNFSSAAHRMLKTARKYQDQAAMASSARLCADDAERLFDAGDFVASADRSLDSLRYSVGILTRVYADAFRDLRIVRQAQEG
jgi:hypothetical protein